MKSVILCYVQALKPVAVKSGSTWDQPAPPYLVDKDVLRVPVATAEHKVIKSRLHHLDVLAQVQVESET
jgi:hypothetical protein